MLSSGVLDDLDSLAPPDLSEEQLRDALDQVSGERERALVSRRRALMVEAVRRGHSTRTIAALARISQPAVAKALQKERVANGEPVNA